ncbi:hypothetical protein [Undibacterium sp. Xuan67W]|uniref:hypothetical protein n=1 Tax=Undibacterium sp. Xuan67W TaxID=3413057 RepID=UPI003BF43A6C
MLEAISFTLSVTVLGCLAVGVLQKKQRLLNFSYGGMMAMSIIGWYQAIFPTGLSFWFFAGTIITVAAICAFFYAIYSNEIIWQKQR